MDKLKQEHPNLLETARMGAVLVDCQTGVTLGAYVLREGADRSEFDDDPGLTDLPSVVSNPRSKPRRND